jgi:hypothetical protein
MFAFLGGLSEPRSVCIEKRYLPSFVVDPPHWHERACCGWHLPHTHMSISYFAGYTYYTAKHDCISACVLCISLTICCGVGEVAYFRFRHGSHDVGGLFRFSILLVNISPVAACIFAPWWLFCVFVGLFLRMKASLWYVLLYLPRLVLSNNGTMQVVFESPSGYNTSANR